LVKECAGLFSVVVLIAPADFDLRIKKPNPPITPMIVEIRAIAEMAVTIGIGDG
jgi:hypothetical protein